VFELLHADIPGCEQGCVIKIYQPNQPDLFFPLGSETVGGMKFSNEKIAPKPGFPDIPQLQNVVFGEKSPIPYIIQAKASPKQLIFSGKQDFLKARIANPKLGAAVMELVRRLKLRGLHMEDFKLANLFFEETAQDEWVAGIVDIDRIMPWGAERAEAPNNFGAWLGYCEASLWPEGLVIGGKVEAPPQASLKNVRRLTLPDESDRALLEYFQKNPGPYYRDIDLTWEKTLEAKQFVIFDLDKKTYIDGILTIEDVEKVLPRINDPERLNPFDASQPFALPPEKDSLRLVPSESAGPPVKLAAMWPESMRMAA
jgi:hypothetical protein